LVILLFRGIGKQYSGPLFAKKGVGNERAPQPSVKAKLTPKTAEEDKRNRTKQLFSVLPREELKRERRPGE